MTRQFFIVCAALCATACSADSAPLVASDVIVTKAIPGTQVSAGYLALSNASRDPITITRVTSPNFGSVQLHESVVEDGIARMISIDELTISPNDTVRLERGGKHLMLMQPVAAPGTVTLQFYADDNLLLSIDTKITD